MCKKIIEKCGGTLQIFTSANDGMREAFTFMFTMQMSELGEPDDLVLSNS